MIRRRQLELLELLPSLPLPLPLPLTSRSNAFESPRPVNPVVSVESNVPETAPPANIVVPTALRYVVSQSLTSMNPR
ncbi:hypothetical protein G7K_6553-t1 [Saitoella complicata NRRL Y-17804]|uniref:Uncharacterized protein n=1 Tax=Saitoella complicata (strain BCRC 22490 / CBS 7301 / JCM 7358 / NBRC 10748 / NRRL Y-17804) TaxID=698492 RepID=A0A0E9NRR9_SAICN|nr:hypothetical protein G7K_6553-t1 [Saitoella complicata NRRL Y-17804]